MNIKEFINKWKFAESNYYKVVDGVVYRNVQAGLIEEESFKYTTRKVGKYRIVAQHFECNLPYTNYFLIFDDKIYYVELHPIWTPNILVDMTNDLRNVIGGD